MKAKQVQALNAAFPYTLPIFAGFWFIGLAYGAYMNINGFSFWYPLLMSAVIFGGSLEFVAVTMLLSPFAPLECFLLALMIQARHIFYGLSMIEKYRHMGIKKLILIFLLCDESFSINYTAKIPEGIDKGWFYLWVSLLNYLYWVLGATIGGIIGNHLPFDTTGLEFVMTAMFVVIFLEQWLNDPQHYTGILGLLVAALCLFIFGRNSFMIPTMIVILISCLAFRPFLSQRIDKNVP